MDNITNLEYFDTMRICSFPRHIDTSHVNFVRINLFEMYFYRGGYMIPVEKNNIQYGYSFRAYDSFGNIFDHNSRWGLKYTDNYDVVLSNQTFVNSNYGKQFVMLHCISDSKLKDSYSTIKSEHEFYNKQIDTMKEINKNLGLKLKTLTEENNDLKGRINALISSNLKNNYPENEVLSKLKKEYDGVTDKISELEQHVLSLNNLLGINDEDIDYYDEN